MVRRRAVPTHDEGVERLSGTGIWSQALRYGDQGPIAEAAAELDELGYSALWIPDVGGDVFGSPEVLAGATRRATVATGILNLWMHSAADTAAGFHRLGEAHGDRFLFGIGVSHAALVDAQEPGRYRRPLEAVGAFLNGLDHADPPLPSSRRVLAALGPRMLHLARDRAAGAIPYNVTPEHTASARAILGPEAQLLPEQAVALTTDAGAARRLGRQHLEIYLTLPNYTNNLRRLGFGDHDLADGGSDRLVDALVAWGDGEAIKARVDEHRAAGADHVCVQVLTDGQPLCLTEWRALAPALVAG